MSEPTDPIARATLWLQRQIVTDGSEPMLDEGDCRFCGTEAGGKHEPTDACGIVSDLLDALRAQRTEGRPFRSGCNNCSGQEGAHDAGCSYVASLERANTDQLIDDLAPPIERPEGRHDVEIIVNGQPVSVTAGPIRTAIAAAIAKSGQIGRPIDQWVLRTRDGEIIPHELPDGNEYALSGGQQFFLHLGLPKIERTEGRPPEAASEGFDALWKRWLAEDANPAGLNKSRRLAEEAFDAGVTFAAGGRSEARATWQPMEELLDGCDLAARRLSIKTGDALIDHHRDGMREAYSDIAGRLRQMLPSASGEDPK